MGDNILNLSGVDDVEDPRIAEAADEVISGLEGLQDALGTEITAVLYDAIAERLDALIDATSEALEAEAANTDDALLEEDDDETDDLLIDQ